MASSETNVGGIVGFLRLDNKDFVAAINQAIGKAEQLDGREIDVTVDADTAGANAQLAATEKQVDKLDKSTARVGATANRTRRHMGALATSIIGLGPAVVPIAAGVTALGVAFGGMATAGVAAIVGIKKEMDEGTDVGLAFGAAIDQAKGDLTDLSRVAAGRVLKPFQDAVADLSDRMPALTDQIGDLASITGLATRALLGGLLNAFQALEPLMRTGAMHVLAMSTAFEDAMAGPGLVSFGEYVRSVLPQVLDALGSITAAAAHLVESLAPLGLGVLTGLQLLSDLLGTIPVEVLSALAEGAWAVFLGFKTWQGLNALIMGVNTALGRMNTTLAISAGAIRGLQIAAGVVGIALAGLTLLLSHNAEQQRQNEQAANDYADALKASNGIIDESIRQMTAKRLADEGAFEASRTLGIGQADIVSAALGEESALRRVNAVLNEHKTRLTETKGGVSATTAEKAKFGSAAALIRGLILGENEALDAGVQKHRDIAAATRETEGATSAAATQAQILADRYNTSAGTYEEVAKRQQEIADKAAAATLQMQLENDAAGLLKQTLDLLNGEAINAASAQNSFDRAMLAVGNSTRDAEGKIDKAKTTLKGAGEEAVTNRGNLLNLAQSAALVAEAYGQQADSSEAGRLKLIELRKQIIDNAVAQGMNRDEVTKFIDEVLKVPAKVPPTKAEMDIAAAKKKKDELQAYINTLKGKTVTLTVKTVYEYLNEEARSARTGRGRLAENGLLTLGNGVRAMADGDVIGTGRQATIMRAMKPILWNEAPGGEAYIPLAPSKRARSLDIWEETGRQLGAKPAAQAQAAPHDYEQMAAVFVSAIKRAGITATLSTGRLDRALGAGRV